MPTYYQEYTVHPPFPPHQGPFASCPSQRLSDSVVPSRPQPQAMLAKTPLPLPLVYVAAPDAFVESTIVSVSTLEIVTNVNSLLSSVLTPTRVAVVASPSLADGQTLQPLLLPMLIPFCRQFSHQQEWLLLPVHHRLDTPSPDNPPLQVLPLSLPQQRVHIPATLLF